MKRRRLLYVITTWVLLGACSAPDTEDLIVQGGGGTPYAEAPSSTAGRIEAGLNTELEGGCADHAELGACLADASCASGNARAAEGAVFAGCVERPTGCAAHLDEASCVADAACRPVIVAATDGICSCEGAEEGCACATSRRFAGCMMALSDRCEGFDRGACLREPGAASVEPVEALGTQSETACARVAGVCTDGSRVCSSIGFKQCWAVPYCGGTYTAWTPTIPCLGGTMCVNGACVPRPPPTTTPVHLKVLVYNLEWADDADYHALADVLQTANPRPDVVLLQEAFWDEGSLSTPYPVLRQRLGTIFPYQAHGPMRTGANLLGSGIVILSRLPFSHTTDKAYDDELFPDHFARKGLATARVEVGGTCPDLRIATTHLQAGKRSDYAGLLDPAETRFAQTLEILEHFSTAWGGADEPIVFGGDFNYFPDEAGTTGWVGYTLLSSALGLQNAEMVCASSSACEKPFGAASYVTGMMKAFFHATPSMSIDVLRFVKHPASAWGGLGDHEVFEVELALGCP